MGDNAVTYVINVSGNATAHINKIAGATTSATQHVGKLCTMFQKFSFISFGLQSASKAFSLIKGHVASLEQAYQLQNVAETKLQQVMRNTMGATNEQIQSIKDLAAEQQKLGVIGDEIQLSGAQELSTYVTKADSIKKLLPAMNDMLAQQYGINASQEQAANIAMMMGKVLDGQVGALSRYGYRFSEAEEQVLKYGNEAQRVAVLAKIIDDAVGGVNAALAETPEGKMKQIANDMGDAKERFGKFITVTKNAFYPVFQTILEKVNKVGDWFERNQERISNVVTKIANAISTAINWIWDAVVWLRDFTVSAFDRIKEAVQKVGNFFAWLGEKIKSLYPIILSVVTVIGAWIWKSNLLRVVKYKLWWQVNLLKLSINNLKNSIIKTTAAIWAKITSIWGAIYAQGTWLGLTIGLTVAMHALKTAINAVSAAIYAIPVIGWILAGVALIIGIIKLLWEKCEGFRRVVFGVWEVVKAFFTNFGKLAKMVWNTIKEVGQAIWQLYYGIFKKIISYFTDIWQSIKGFFSWIGNQFTTLWNWIKSVGQKIADFFTGIFSSVGGFFTGIWQRIKGFFSSVGEQFSALWNWIKDFGQKIADFFTGIFTSVGSFFTGIWEHVSGFFSWLWEIFKKVGSAIKKAFQPLLDFFSNLWDFVKKIFSWILDKMAAIFNPIIKLWNQLTGKVVETYKTGAEKGSESFRKSKEKKEGKEGKDASALPGVVDLKGGKGDGGPPGSVKKGAEATATGGTRNTQITIHLGKFFDNMVFNGGVGENVRDIERRMEEILLRVLYSAQNAG